jgi:hypothetical protein
MAGSNSLAMWTPNPDAALIWMIGDAGLHGSELEIV